MSDEEIRAYFAPALDPVACKATLHAALISRVDALLARGISKQKLLYILSEMYTDIYLVEDETVLEVLEQF